jgi:hypothetical protein
MVFYKLNLALEIYYVGHRCSRRSVEDQREENTSSASAGSGKLLFEFVSVTACYRKCSQKLGSLSSRSEEAAKCNRIQKLLWASFKLAIAAIYDFIRVEMG